MAKGSMIHLEVLKIWVCGIEAIVSKDEVSEAVNATIVSPSSLKLKGLPISENFYPHSHGSKNEASSSSAFQQQSERTLDLKYRLFSNDQVSFPKLENLELSNFNKLIPSMLFSNVKTLTVKKCGFVKLVSLHVLKSLNNLEELEVADCNMLEMVFDLEDLNSSKEAQPSLLVVPLKKLELQRLPKLKHVWRNDSQGIVSFQSLRKVYVNWGGSLTSIFPASIAKGGMLNLEELQIFYCWNLEVIIAKDEVSESVAPTFVFPRLISLQLEWLPNLKNFYPQSHKSQWPRLQIFSIGSCGDFKICRQVIPNLEQLALDRKQAFLFEFLKKFLNFESLEPLGEAVIPPFRQLFLTYVEKVKHIWNEPLPPHILQHLETLNVYHCYDLISLGPSSISLINLTEICVSDCEDLTSLLTSSTATSLANLLTLIVTNCKQIEEIITMPQGEDDDVEEIIFNKLGHLKLDGLLRLKSFCNHNYIFKFPLLYKVIIKGCPRLRMFCPEGDIDTPLLKCVEVDPNLKFWDTNLNFTIQQRFATKKVISTSGTLVLDMKDITMIRNGQFPLDSFPEVGTLCVESFIDNGVSFPYSILERFPNLRELHVENSSFEEIFPSQTHTDMEKQAAFEELHLAHLDQLKNIWDDDSQLQSQNLKVLKVESCCSLIKLAPSSASFENLTELKVSSCHQLLYLVTSSTAQSLGNLHTLKIKNCKMMEEIVTNETNEDVDGGITFQSLTTLKLANLPILKRFCTGVAKTPVLSMVKIEEDYMDWKDEGDLKKTIELLFPSKVGRNI